jgi:hypothetical protein
MALGQVFSKYFGFPCQSSFHQLPHNHYHLSSGAGTIGQQWPTYEVDSISPYPEKLKKKTNPQEDDQWTFRILYWLGSPGVVSVMCVLFLTLVVWYLRIICIVSRVMQEVCHCWSVSCFYKTKRKMAWHNSSSMKNSKELIWEVYSVMRSYEISLLLFLF